MTASSRSRDARSYSIADPLIEYRQAQRLDLVGAAAAVVVRWRLHFHPLLSGAQSVPIPITTPARR
jgi:hypothetical protein